MRVLIIAAAALLSSGCAATEQQPDGTALARTLAGRVAGPVQQCVSAPPSQNLIVIDAQHVALEKGPVLYLNRLRAACPSLDPHNNLIVERNGPDLCQGDRVRPVEPGAIIAGASCNLQTWVPYR